MTAVAAKTDRSDLRLFKESISAAGVLTLVETRWFTNDADRELPAPPGGARGEFTATARLPDHGEPPPHLVRRGGRRFGKQLEDRLVTDMFEELVGSRRVLRPRKGGLSDPAVFQFPYPKLYKAGGVGGRNGVWVMTPMAWGKCKHQYRDLIRIDRPRHPLDGEIHTLGGEPVVVHWLNGEALGVLYGDFRRGLTVTVAEAPPDEKLEPFKDPDMPRLRVKVQWAAANADRFVCWE